MSLRTVEVHDTSHILHWPDHCSRDGMANILRTSLALALLLLVTGASPAVADTVTNTSSGLLGGLGNFASLAMSRLPESGALLIWATGLAAASRATSRKRDSSDK